jgi:hypothetical protein
MFSLLPELFQLESDQHLEIYNFQLPNSNLKLWDTGLCHKCRSCMHFSLPNTTRPVYFRQLIEVILPPNQNVVRIRK